MNWKKNTIRLVIAVISLAALNCAEAVVAKVPSAIMVIPARYRVVELGFDMARLCNVGLISYQKEYQTGDVLLHVWNGREWIRIAPPEYVSGRFLLGAPDVLIVVGDEKVLPEMLTVPPEWCPKVERVKELDVGSIINGAGPVVKLSQREYKWLADKYNLTLTDLNAERRRYGRYGPPGQEKIPDWVPASKRGKAMEKIDLPPPPAPAAEEKNVPVPLPAPVAEVKAVEPTPAAVIPKAVEPESPKATPSTPPPAKVVEPEVKTETVVETAPAVEVKQEAVSPAAPATSAAAPAPAATESAPVKPLPQDK